MTIRAPFYDSLPSPWASGSWHWRRWPGADCAVDQNNVTVVASACGKLVDYRTAVGDPDEAGCPECLQVHRLLATPNQGERPCGTEL